MSHTSSTVPDVSPLAVTGEASRWRTIAVPWNPLACTYASIGPRRVPLDGRSRTVALTGWPTAYSDLTTTSTRPFGTVVGTMRSRAGAGVGITVGEHATRR